MIAFQEREDLYPVCPHCKAEVRDIFFRAFKGDLGKRCIYFCPHCRATLGVSQRKGLTFGW